MINKRFLFPLLLLVGQAVWPAGSSALAASAPLPLDSMYDQPIGLATAWYAENEDRLTLNEAIKAYKSGAYETSDAPILTFGIGANPVWIRFAVDNASREPATRRITIDTAWLDKIEMFILRAGTVVGVYQSGDSFIHKQRPIHGRAFTFQHAFAPGISEIFLRVQTADPMVVPVYLETLEQTAEREDRLHYSYGFLYGFLFALLAYNLMLFAGLRQPRYLLYSIYLGVFLVLNLSYTGHAYAWFWSDSPLWAQWSNPVLMLLYGATGFLFALNFLRIRERFPRVFRLVIGIILATAGLLGMAALFGHQSAALLVTFVFALVFSAMMVFLGLIAFRAGEESAQYFLAASVCAMLGAASTALSVWGIIPFNIWTYRAVDIGMLMEATLLALALTYQFRVVQQERVLAEELARIDPLTSVNNRRAFYEICDPIWSRTLRHDRDLAIIVIDLDRFKQVNDTHGHAAGDEMLKAVAACIRKTVRKEDVITRWGGEEFLLLLPDTDIRNAGILAERLREVIQDCRVNVNTGSLSVTASLGVAHRSLHHLSIDSLISSADHYLYEAKAKGGNRVVIAPLQTVSPDNQPVFNNAG